MKGYGSKSPHLDLKNKSEYQNYEQDLNNYLKRGRSDIEEWSLMESKLFSSPSKKNAYHKQIASHDNSNVRPKQMRNEQVQAGKDPKINTTETDGNKKSSYETYLQNKQSYCSRIHSELVKGNPQKLKNQEINASIKKMRKLLIELNEEANSKLNRYQMAHFSPKTMVKSHEPEKESILFQAQIENNRATLEAQKRDIEAIQKREKELEQRDFMIELEERANQVMKQIHDRKKQKHDKGVILQKLDSKLIEIRQKDQAIADEEQFSIIKVVKHQMLHYFKKFHQNKARLDELQKNYEELMKKDNQLSEKYNTLSQKAAENNMLVKANKQYIQLKQLQDELKQKVEKANKSVQVAMFSAQLNSQKVEKQIQKLKKESQKTEQKIITVNQISQQFAEKADKLIEQHKIGESMVKNMSYKYAETFIKDSQLKLSKQIQLEEQAKKQKLYIKPKLKISTKKNISILDRSQQNSSRYRTVQPHSKANTMHIKKTTSINDKNHETLGSLDKLPPMKPNMRIKKLKGDTLRKQKSEDRQLESESKFIDMPHRSNRVNKLKLEKSKSKKIQVPAGPLSDEYMKGLEKKGLKNLSVL